MIRLASPRPRPCRGNNGTATNYFSQASALVTGVPVTLSCWFVADNVTAYYTLMSVLKTAAGSDSYAVLGINGTVAGDPVMAEYTNGSIYANADSTTGYTAGRLHHACGVFSAINSRTAYIDGGSSATNTTNVSGAATWTGATVGGYTDGDGSFDGIAGRILLASVHNVALTAQEVATLARWGCRPWDVRGEALVACWLLDEPVQGRAYDSNPRYPGRYNLTQNGTMKVMPSGLVARPVARPVDYRRLFFGGAGGGTTTSPAAVALSAAVAAPTLLLVAPQTPVTPTPTLASPTLVVVVPPIAVPLTVTPPTPTQTLVSAQSSVVGAVVVAAPAVAVAFGAVALTASAAAPVLVLASPQSPVAQTTTTPGPTVALTPAVSPVAQAAVLVAPTAALAQAAVVTGAAATPATPAQVLVLGQTPVALTVTLPAVTTLTSGLERPDPVAASATVVAPALALTAPSAPVALTPTATVPAPSVAAPVSPITASATPTAPTPSLVQAASSATSPVTVPSATTITGGGARRWLADHEMAGGLNSLGF